MSEAEFWSRTLGFDLSKLHEFKQEAQERAARLARLRDELKRCGKCADQTRLSTAVDQQDAELRAFVGPPKIYSEAQRPSIRASRPETS